MIEIETHARALPLLRRSTPRRVAIVHHWFVQRGGAERVVEEIAGLFPEADLFTLLARDRGLGESLRGRNIHSSFLQRIPFACDFHRLLMPLYPIALESLDLSGYDLVISSESGPSKGVLTSANCCHICYCHSPMRYIWEMPGHYRKSLPGGWLGRQLFDVASHYLRIWDYSTAARVDHFLASSANGARRIAKVYGRAARVIHPPVEMSRFSLDPENMPEDYYLVVGRLVSYKRIDLAIEACNRLGRKLVIIGNGEQLSALRRIAGPTIEFKPGLDDEQVRLHLRKCRAFLFPGEEDIGLTPIEAQASGRPVIAYGRGGALETVVPLDAASGPEAATGVFFYEPTADALAEAILQCEAVGTSWRPGHIRAQAERFDSSRFRRQFLEFVDSAYSGDAPPAAAAHKAAGA